jgi:hypothetical protein
MKIISMANLGLSTLWRSFKRVRFDGLVFAKNEFGSFCIPADADHRPAA